MITRPHSSRQRLVAVTFEQKEDEHWFLSIGGGNAEFYSQLFQALHSEVMQRSNTGWRTSKSGKAKYAFFKSLANDEVATVESFIEDYRKLPILDLNTNIEPYFSTELDACIALDFNKDSPTSENRTEVGELEYRAKYGDSTEAVDQLAALIVGAIPRVPPRHDCERCLLTFIPPTRDKEFHLPRELARKVAAEITGKLEGFDDNSLVEAVLTVPKESLKNLSLAEKVEVWEHIVENGSVKLSQSVEDAAVYVIDDLYQSGVTMWSFAKYLKSVGAAAALGCVAVKSLRDTDNQ